jgi:hypothetical protein
MSISSVQLVVFSLVILPLLATCQECQQGGCFTREMLDVWTRFRKDRHFDTQGLWERMDACFQRKNTLEINLWNVSDAFWKGFIEYGLAGGSMDGSDAWEGGGPFMESNPTPLVGPQDADRFPNLPNGTSNILIDEPCNTVSHMAHFRTFLAVCEHEITHEWTIDPETVTALVQAHSLLAPGGMLPHASGTQLGTVLDDEFLNQALLIAHQGSIQSLPYDPILHDISEMPANYSGREAVALASLVIANDPVDEWLGKLKELNTRQYVLPDEEDT